MYTSSFLNHILQWKINSAPAYLHTFAKQTSPSNDPSSRRMHAARRKGKEQHHQPRTTATGQICRRPCTKATLKRPNSSPRDHVNTRLLQTMTPGIRLYRALEPECRILMFMWSFRPLSMASQGLPRLKIVAGHVADGACSTTRRVARASAVFRAHLSFVVAAILYTMLLYSIDQPYRLVR